MQEEGDDDEEANDMYSPIAATTTTTTQTLQLQQPTSSPTTSDAIILVAKFDYKAKDSQELSLKKNERLILLDSSKNWWLVQKYSDTSQQG